MYLFPPPTGTQERLRGGRCQPSLLQSVPAAWLRVTVLQGKGGRGDGQENWVSWAPIPEVALAATQGQLPPEFCQHSALAQLDPATELVGATLAGHTNTWEQTSGGDSGETARCLSWTGLWLVEMKPVEPPIFYIYGLCTVLTSLMIFFFFLIRELAPTGTLPGTFRKVFQAAP